MLAFQRTFPTPRAPAHASDLSGEQICILLVSYAQCIVGGELRPGAFKEVFINDRRDGNEYPLLPRSQSTAALLDFAVRVSLEWMLRDDGMGGAPVCLSDID